MTVKAAENRYVGINCGKLDQSCEVLSKKKHLLYLDNKNDSFELTPTVQTMKPHKMQFCSPDWIDSWPIPNTTFARMSAKPLPMH